MGALKIVRFSLILAGAAFAFAMIKDPLRSEASDTTRPNENISDTPKSTRRWAEPPASFQHQQSSTHAITRAQPNAAAEPQAGTAPPDPPRQVQPLAQAVQKAPPITPTEPQASSEVRPAEAPIASAVPPTQARRSLTPAEAAAYISRARAKIQQGDIAAARRLLERAAESDQGDALFALAETYDPQMLARWGVIGTKPDVELAKTLYQKAETRGAQGARERLLAIRK
jgi:hypothetical protein